MNFIGLIIGAATFLCIGVFHPLVIKGEYYLGKRKSYWLFAILGCIALTASLLLNNNYISIITGVIAFSSFWGIHEVYQQHERVRKGWFPMNPRHKDEYEE